MAPRALVTGASTGIGRATATHLAGLGFDVLAGVRDPGDAPPGLEPIQLDVTEPGHVAAAAERVGGTLHALVNNAGIGIPGPVEAVPVAEWRRQMEVDVLGQVAVTQAMLPAVLNARGRIVNMSSISGRVALPLLGTYAASKFALEAMTDALRREIETHGVYVVSVEPGGIVTPIWDKGIARSERVLEDMPAEVRRRYERLFAAVRREADRRARDGLPPEAVAEVVGRALTARRPRTRYVVGRDARVRAALVRLLPDRAYDALIRRVLT